MTQISTTEIDAYVGKEIGVSPWIEIDQYRIDSFAVVTEDDQFIHLDPERAAKETPFGGTIAHGFLSLSMLSKMAMDIDFGLAGTVMGINYGFDKVRFLQPVKTGSKIRGRMVLDAVKERQPGQWMLTYGVTVEIEGSEKPALVAQWLTLLVQG